MLKAKSKVRYSPELLGIYDRVFVLSFAGKSFPFVRFRQTVLLPRSFRQSKHQVNLSLDIPSQVRRRCPQNQLPVLVLSVSNQKLHVVGILDVREKLRQNRNKLLFQRFVDRNPECHTVLVSSNDNSDDMLFERSRRDRFFLRFGSDFSRRRQGRRASTSITGIICWSSIVLSCVVKHAIVGSRRLSSGLRRVQGSRSVGRRDKGIPRFVSTNSRRRLHRRTRVC